ncbi:MAG: ABC transporter ATP-binding protein [Bacteroidales bacterium]|nr:ABC transporter ATP-binding protein [Bacteroidales bacterium]
MKYLKRLTRYLLNYKANIAGVLLVNVLYAFFSIFTLGLIVPFLSVLFEQVEPVTAKPEFALTSRYFIDTFYYYMGVVVVRHGKHSALFYIAGSMMLSSLLSNASRYLGAYWLAPIRSGIMRDLRNDMYHRLLILPLSYYSEQRKGDILSRIGADVQEVEWSVFSSLQSLLRDPFLIIIFLIALFSISVKMTLIALVILPAIAYLLAIIGKGIRKFSTRTQQLLGKMSSYFEEAIGGLRVIKGYNAIDHTYERFEQENFKFYKLNKKVFRINEVGSPLTEFLCILALMVITLVGFKFFPDVSLGKSTLFMLFFVVFARLIVPAKAMVTTFYTLQRGMAAAARVYEVIDADEKILECENALPVSKLKSTIEFKDVSFSYRDVKVPEECEVLQHVDLTIQKGQTIAIVGPSGSGKSTIVDLLPRFYDVHFGQILLDGTPLDRYIISDLRALFGMVSQDVVLFNDTVYENIVFGMENVTEEQVVAAAKVAQAHDFIMEMENGYDTVIGDRGMRLSGGQRQRLSIARAILRQPEVLILDEATSALDNESEYLFQEALIPYARKHTAIIIAHRLSTIRFADLILFVRDGRIVEQGTHNELMQMHGEYYSFHSAQQ